MRHTSTRILFFMSLVAASLACKSQATPTAAPPLAAEAIKFDCTANSPDCPPIEIEGDSPALLPSGEESPFRGFADPSVRRDPVSGELWLAYSAPNLYVVHNDRPSPGVEIHLASSKDGGASWQYQGVLWEVQAAKNPTNNEDGTIDHEVANLLPVQTESGVTWYGVRLDYFLPEKGAFKARPFDSFHLQIAQADSPLALADAETAILSTDQTAPEWNADLNLASLDPSLSRCAMWNEPALHFQNGELFLVVRCLVFESGVAAVENSDLILFAAEPAADVHDMKWRYVGVLAGGEEARQLGGNGLTQVDLALGMDGQLLAILTPDSWSNAERDFVHYGCRVVEVESLDPPALKKDEQGNLIVRAEVTTSDLPALGPGACAYDPALTVGLIITRRLKLNSSMEAWLHATGITP